LISISMKSSAFPLSGPDAFGIIRARLPRSGERMGRPDTEVF